MRSIRIAPLAVAALLAPGPCGAAGLDAFGNVDGVITWRLGTIEMGASAREAAIFSFGPSPDAVKSALDAARRRFERLPPPAPRDGAAGGDPAWIANAATDFAIGPGGIFRWDMKRQSLAGPGGGQLSQFTWYVHWWDSSGRHRAGTPHHGDEGPENLEVVEPVAPAGKDEASGRLATADGKLEIRIRAAMAEGTAAGIEFVLANVSPEPLADVRLSVYANIEAAHTHEGDYAALDARTAGLLVHDPETGACAVLAGLHPPLAGYAGTWNSLPYVQGAEGIGLGSWRPFAGVPRGLRERIERETAAARGIYLPYGEGEVATPETRALTSAEAAAALERDWLFQAMGKPLAGRAREEIRWAR